MQTAEIASQAVASVPTESLANQNLANLLAEIANYYTLEQDTYRAKAFANASQLIGQYPEPIVSGQQARKVLTGIGPSIQVAIDEYLAAGQADQVTRLVQLKNKHQAQQVVLDSFTALYGIGPVTALKFYKAGYRTLEDLWFKAPLTEAQKQGIIWREHIKLRIPREEMALIEDTLHQLLDPYGLTWEIAGSYRRGEPDSGDIDILVAARPDFNMEGLLSLLQEILPVTLAAGPTKFMGLLRLSDSFNAHRVDIRLVPPENYAFALLYFTGSQRFNILLRQRALQLGLTLNEYRLQNQEGQNLPAKTEADIFRWLGVEYLAPEARNKNLATLSFS